jgi:hypothetical protein
MAVEFGSEFALAKLLAEEGAESQQPCTHSSHNALRDLLLRKQNIPSQVIESLVTQRDDGIDTNGAPRRNIGGNQHGGKQNTWNHCKDCEVTRARPVD